MSDQQNNGEDVTPTGDCWSEDEEDFRYESLGDLIDSCGSGWEPGRVVYIGDKAEPDPAVWVDADDIIENLACRAGDDHGEWADDYPDITKEAKQELQDFLEVWARKHATPSFYGVKNIRLYTITAEDLGREK